jgi:hypothetical protein
VYRCREVVEALRELLREAEEGRIRGLAFVVKVAPGDNRADMVGEYRRHPEKAMKATFALEKLLREDMA